MKLSSRRWHHKVIQAENKLSNIQSLSSYSKRGVTCSFSPFLLQMSKTRLASMCTRLQRDLYTKTTFPSGQRHRECLTRGCGACEPKQIKETYVQLVLSFHTDTLNTVNHYSTKHHQLDEGCVCLSCGCGKKLLWAVSYGKAVVG